MYRTADSPGLWPLQSFINRQREHRGRQGLVLVEFIEQIVDSLIQTSADVHTHAVNDDKVPHRKSHGSDPYSDRDVRRVTRGGDVWRHDLNGSLILITVRHELIPDTQEFIVRLLEPGIRISRPLRWQGAERPVRCEGTSVRNSDRVEERLIQNMAVVIDIRKKQIAGFQGSGDVGACYRQAMEIALLARSCRRLLAYDQGRILDHIMPRSAGLPEDRDSPRLPPPFKRQWSPTPLGTAPSAGPGGSTMAKQAKGNWKTRKAERVQVVFKVEPAVKALLEKTARDLGISMNSAAESRLATGRWPRPLKEAK